MDIERKLIAMEQYLAELFDCPASDVDIVWPDRGDGYVEIWDGNEDSDCHMPIAFYGFQDIRVVKKHILSAFHRWLIAKKHPIPDWLIEEEEME